MSPDSSHPRRSAYRQYLARRRALAHDAHVAADHPPPPDVPQHPLIYAGPTQVIGQSSPLVELVGQLRAAGRFGYDTEFIGETTYYPNLCLIQLATSKHLSLVDPLDAGADLDLTPLYELLADASVQKIVHAGEVDLELVVRHLKRPPANVFDTQIAAGLVGLGYPTGLHQLLRDVLNVDLPKSATFTQWDRRPLSPVHLRYAADDVRYLPALHAGLVERLESMGRTAWAEEELAKLNDMARYRFDPDSAVARIVRTHNMTRRQRRLLRALVKVRDRLARRRNLPPRSMFQDKSLVDLTHIVPINFIQLRGIPGLSRRLIESHGSEILQTISRVVTSASWQKPSRRRRQPLSPEQRNRIDPPWKQLKQRCVDAQVALMLVATRPLFTELAVRLLRKRPVPENHPLLMGWRRQFVEPVLEELK